jgi:dTDP-4-dehydrorhamnose reductase
MILIAGSGDLAVRLTGLLSEQGGPAVMLDRGPVMNRDINSIAASVDSLKPEIIINCHEYPFIDEAEYWRGEAYDTNAFFPKELAGICRDRDLLLVHASSSYIFSGEPGAPWKETDQPDPRTFYGDSKNLGEKFISESGCRSLIIRFAELIPTVINIGHNSIFMRRGDTFHCVEGQTLTPVFTGEAAAAIARLVSRRAEGVYHVTQGAPVSAASLARDLLDLCAEEELCSGDLTVKPLDRREYGMPAERPLNNSLDNTKYITETGSALTLFVESMKEAVKINHSRYSGQFAHTE